MKKWLSIIVALSLALSAQSQNLLGLDDNPILNQQEAQLLDSLLHGQPEKVDFANKRLAFITGSSGSVLLSKSEFFRKNVLPWTVHGQKPALMVIPLTEAEQAASGGYEALTLVWVKVFTQGRKEKVLKQLARLSTTSDK
jgi:hypothetical protein